MIKSWLNFPYNWVYLGIFYCRWFSCAVQHLSIFLHFYKDFNWRFGWKLVWRICFFNYHTYIYYPLRERLWLCHRLSPSPQSWLLSRHTSPFDGPVATMPRHPLCCLSQGAFCRDSTPPSPLMSLMQVTLLQFFKIWWVHLYPAAYTCKLCFILSELWTRLTYIWIMQNSLKNMFQIARTSNNITVCFIFFYQVPFVRSKCIFSDHLSWMIIKNIHT